MALEASEREKLKKRALKVRRGIVEVTHTCGGSHVGGSMSQTDILTALYFKYLKYDPKNPLLESRDRCILSKGHGGVGHAVVLSEAGFFDRKELDDFNKTGSPFGMHLDWLKVKGVDASTGSLGHGLSIGNGMALGARMSKQPWHTYVVMGDGEMNAGPVWESAMATAHFKLDNLTAYVDRNRLCIDGSTEEIMALEPFVDKWKAFGWNVLEIDGHDFDQICDATDKALAEKGKPTVIVCNTVKGKGVDFMENRAEWHYAGLDEGMRDKALASLEKGAA
jgi:transketolase